MIHSKEEWEKLIKEFQESGLSQRKWCSISGENRKMLQYWISRLEYLKLGKNIVFAEIVIGGGSDDTDTSE